RALRRVRRTMPARRVCRSGARPDHRLTLLHSRLRLQTAGAVRRIEQVIERAFADDQSTPHLCFQDTIVPQSPLSTEDDIPALDERGILEEHPNRERALGSI